MIKKLFIPSSENSVVDSDSSSSELNDNESVPSVISFIFMKLELVYKTIVLLTLISFLDKDLENGARSS